MDKNVERGIILVTGGSGLIGRRLTAVLSKEGYEIRILSRKKVLVPGARVFKWDYRKEFIDSRALKGIDHLVHLSGASIAEGRWTGERKREIIESRTLSAHLLFKELSGMGVRLKSFICASATGYYGAVPSDIIFREDDPSGHDFAAVTCEKWEAGAARFREIAERVVIIRTGIVLSCAGGMLGTILPAARAGFSPLPGNGRQWVPWIHIDDLASIYLKAVTDTSTEGVYNAVSPEPATYSELIGKLEAISGRRIFKPVTPAFILKIIFGEKSGILLTGSRVSPGKILNAGFSFSYPGLKSSLENLLAGD
ncbi:MAG: TIGR01777 family protein [Bacteroidia bacterium]|nr:MAG: TIGR01777 family protein [Bacteroidia bacterium]